MERDTYKFRAKARIVAFVDLILSSMFLCLCLILFIGLLGISHRLSSNPDAKLKIDGNLLDDSNRLDKSDKFRVGEGVPLPNKAFINLMWVFLALITIMTGVQILAAVRLLNATQLGKDPNGAMKLCRFWRRVCFFFTGLLIFNFLSSFRQRGENFFEVTFLMTSILIRIVALYIVQQYVNELVSAMAGSLPMHHFPQMPLPDLSGVNMAYVPPYPKPMSSHSNNAPPPKYEDVVKEPFNCNQTFVA